MAKPRGLRQRGGSWEMRVRVPNRLRETIGKREIIKSFGGVTTREAYRLAIQERATIERQFEQAEVQLGLATAVLPPLGQAELSEDQITAAAERYLRDLEASAPRVPIDEAGQEALREAVAEELFCMRQPGVVEDATLQGSADHFASQIGLPLPNGPSRFTYYEAIREASVEHFRRQSQRLNGARTPTVNPAFVHVDAQNGGEDAGLTLAEAIDLYIKAPERSGNTASTFKMDRSRLGTVRDLIGGHRPVRSIVRADLRAYVEQLRALPAHYTQRFPGMSPAEAIAEGEKLNAPKLTPTSIKRQIEATRALFAWLEKEEFIDKNPVTNIHGPKAPKKSSRRSFSTEEMSKFLEATSVTVRGGKDWTYWSSRIAILHGFRLTEPLGLQVKDLVKLGDIWIIRLRENEFRGLKTPDTARDVPIHPRLIELGILELLAGRQPDDLLIPDTPLSKGRAFNAAQKQMGRLLRAKVSTDPNLTFHSSRHNFRDAMLDGGFPYGVDARLGGWKAGNNRVMDNYGRGYKIEMLNEWIAKVAYPEVVID
jgi:integrase